MTPDPWEKPRNPKDFEWEKSSARRSASDSELPEGESGGEWAWKVYLGFVIAAIAGIAFLAFGGYLGDILARPR